MSDGRVNGAIRVKANVARVSDAVMPFSVPDTSQGIRAALEHMQRERRELGGSALDMASSEMQIGQDRKSTRLNSSHVKISYAVFCLKKKKEKKKTRHEELTM